MGKEICQLRLGLGEVPGPLNPKYRLALQGHLRGELQLRLEFPRVQGHPNDLEGDEQLHLP